MGVDSQRLSFPSGSAARTSWASTNTVMKNATAMNGFSSNARTKLKGTPRWQA